MNDNNPIPMRPERAINFSPMASPWDDGYNTENPFALKGQLISDQWHRLGVYER